MDGEIGLAPCGRQMMRGYLAITLVWTEYWFARFLCCAYNLLSISSERWFMVLWCAVVVLASACLVCPRHTLRHDSCRDA